MSNNRYGGVDSYAAFFIGYKVKQLIRSPFFTYDDYEDLQQELMLAYLLAWPTFDKSKGNRKSFIKAVINNRAGWIVEEAKRQKRWTGQKDISLSTQVFQDENTIEMIDLFSNEDHVWGDVFASISHISAEQKIDMEYLLSELPPELSDLFYQLQSYSIKDISRNTGLAQSTVFSRVKRLRQFLKENYFDKN